MSVGAAHLSGQYARSDYWKPFRTIIVVMKVEETKAGDSIESPARQTVAEVQSQWSLDGPPPLIATVNLMIVADSRLAIAPAEEDIAAVAFAQEVEQSRLQAL